MNRKTDESKWIRSIQNLDGWRALVGQALKKIQALVEKENRLDRFLRRAENRYYCSHVFA